MGGFAIGTFIDMEEAFDSTLGATIKAALRRYEVSYSKQEMGTPHAGGINGQGQQARNLS